MKTRHSAGFTLLELLLVVGIASVLIIGSITTYNLVARSRKINDTVTLINILFDKLHVLYAQGQYGANGTNFVPLLVNSGYVPPKYILANTIVTPYSNDPLSIYTWDGTISIWIKLPIEIIPELAVQFWPGDRVEGLRICNTTFMKTDPKPDVATLSTLCIPQGTAYDNYFIVNMK